jgi:RNA-directed DNA polymerase
MSEAKPYKISRRLVWEAWKQVRENRGAEGVDGVSLAAFDLPLQISSTRS